VRGIQESNNKMTDPTLKEDIRIAYLAKYKEISDPETKDMLHVKAHEVLDRCRNINFAKEYLSELKKEEKEASGKKLRCVQIMVDIITEKLRIQSKLRSDIFADWTQEISSYKQSDPDYAYLLSFERTRFLVQCTNVQSIEKYMRNIRICMSDSDPTKVTYKIFVYIFRLVERHLFRDLKNMHTQMQGES
jgi:hypothetical protein